MISFAFDSSISKVCQLGSWYLIRQNEQRMTIKEMKILKGGLYLLFFLTNIHKIPDESNRNTFMN